MELSAEERRLIQRQIAAIIDLPSLFMGGPSRGSMEKASRIIDELVRGKRLEPSSCTHEGWTDHTTHGIYCPDCGKKMQVASLSKDEASREFARAYQEARDGK